MTGEWFEQSRTRRIVLCLIVGLFAITNVPWTLDDYDQAKQAFTSFEMVEQGHWLYQHTPNEKRRNEAAADRMDLGGAFRSDTLVGRRMANSVVGRRARAHLADCHGRHHSLRRGAGLIALSAFGLNLLSPRIATLVRTDMPLALVTFLIGRQVWLKICRAERVDTATIAPMAFALLTTCNVDQRSDCLCFHFAGARRLPIAQSQARLLPSAWCGWWPWIVSLGVFLVWAIGGIAESAGLLRKCSR